MNTMKQFFIFCLICISILTMNAISHAQDINGNDIPDACEPGMAEYDPTDLDNDSVNDACEEALASKFSPVIHKDPRDKQE